MKGGAMRYILLILIINLSFAIERGGFGGFMFVLDLPDVEGLNQDFSQYKIPEVSGRLIGIGGSGFAVLKRILIGGGGYSGREVAESESIRVELTISGGEFKLGYNLISTRYLNGAISTGFGGSTYRLSLCPRLEQVSFNEILADPKRYVELEGSHFLIHPEAILIFSIPYQPISFLHIGISGGVNLNIFPEEWSYKGIKVLQGPKLGVANPNLSLKILLGGGV